LENTMNTNLIANISKQSVDDRATALARSRYDRIAPVYDLMQFMVERLSQPWRKKLWQMVGSAQVLEIGVGTGINIELWPSEARVTAIDISPRMLEQASTRADRLSRQADLRLGDVQRLDFPNASFDVAIATFVFCSVPDPVLGLHEVGRVVRPGGKILLLEHMLSPNPVLGAFMNAINPLVVRMIGSNINRRTLENIRAAGLSIESAEDLDETKIFKRIVARSR
jgi:ubiquinone/menaquinone biosynthesis C-methylase UbiE